MDLYNWTIGFCATDYTTSKQTNRPNSMIFDIQGTGQKTISSQYPLVKLNSKKSLITVS